MEILRLVRYKNLLIVAATMLLVRYFIMEPILHSFGFELQLGLLSFAMLVMATVCITAAGYVINDYFDTRTDLVNRPQTVVVGKSVSRRMA
ncbi:MAG TPA: prenyltransferase, partial [Tenuifilaceae bacterium]|nr:prenyltransferase [Tenuifilaceae bacterium]